MNNNFKLVTFASNDDGNKIFCRLTYKKKTVAKGYYDFEKEKFFITKLIKTNFIDNLQENIVKDKLIEILKIDYDWNL
jgi:hypothetical protein